MQLEVSNVHILASRPSVQKLSDSMFPPSAQSNFDLENDDKNTEKWHSTASAEAENGNLQEVESVRVEYPEGGPRAWSVLLGA